MRELKQSPKVTPEPIGKRIARLRATRGWTQQNLAERLGISRVAVSHIEMELSTPSERTITLLAGLFKCLPHELVAGSTYPRAKGEKLPQTACAYTPVELELALFDNDLAWLDRLADSDMEPALSSQICRRWAQRLESLAAHSLDESEQAALARACKRLKERMQRP
jgi:transcriptional regulator with XRE-family HTH domain